MPLNLLVYHGVDNLHACTLIFGNFTTNRAKETQRRKIINQIFNLARFTCYLFLSLRMSECVSLRVFPQGFLAIIKSRKKKTISRLLLYSKRESYSCKIQLSF